MLLVTDVTLEIRHNYCKEICKREDPLSGIERGIDGGTASIVATSEPVAAIIFGVLIFNDRLGILQVLGIVIVLIGITWPVLRDKAIQQV